MFAIRAPQPDVLVAAEGTAFAVRGADGRLAMIKSGSDTFAFREWLMADADLRAPKDKALGEGIRCDGAGCIGRLRDGSLVAIANTIEAFDEDCRRAAVVLTARDAPPGCAALVVDRQALKHNGAVALRRVGQGFEMMATRPAGYDRPWARALPAPNDTPETGRSSATRRQPPDATPSTEDLEPGD